MKKNSILLYRIFILMILQASGVFGQSVEGCNIVYNYLEEMPKYKGGEKDLVKYIFDELITVVSKCEQEPLITSLYLSLIIQKNGKVGGVEFKRIQASEDCKSKKN